MIFLIVTGGLFMAACGSGPETTSETQAGAPATSYDAQRQESFEIVTLLPPDAIPSIDDPEFYEVDQADAEYEPEETVIGLELGGEARAYSTALLSSHEIVNDEINGRPIAVTW